MRKINLIEAQKSTVFKPVMNAQRLFRRVLGNCRKRISQHFTSRNHSGKPLVLVRGDSLFIVAIILTANFIICSLGFSQETRNPFKDWFPVIKIEEIEKPPVEVEEKIFDVSLYKLEGVVWGQYSPKAIINNKIYNIGGKLDEAEIIKIDKIGVTVNFNGKEFIIRTKNVTIDQENAGVDNEKHKEE